RPCKGYRFIAEAITASTNGNTTKSQVRHDWRNSRIAPANKSKSGSTIPIQRGSGGTRFKGLTRISSRIPPALARLAASRGNGQSGRKAKSQNIYIVVYGLRSACDARYATTKLSNQSAPIATQKNARRKFVAERTSATPQPAMTNAEENEHHGAR